MENTFKTGILLTLLTLILVWLGYLIGGPKHGVNYAFVGLLIALGMNFFSYWFSDKIILAMYRAKEVSAGESPELHRIVARLSERGGIPMPKIYIIPTQTPNAFATGRNPENAAVAVTEGIMSMLNSDELEGVLAHELSHVTNRDILLSTVVAAIAGAISFISRWALYFGGGRRDDREGGNPLVLLVAAIFVPIAAMFIQLWISRTREFAADEGGGRLSGKPEALASALQKLEYYARKPNALENPATAHIFIVSPLSGKSFVTLLSTHPSTEKRIARLMELAQQLGKVK